MPMNYEYDPKKLSEETRKIFRTGIFPFDPFQSLCIWLYYYFKFSYRDRKGDHFWKDNAAVLTEEHVEKIIQIKLFRATNPEEYNEESLRSMLKEFVGLKVWST